MDTTVLQGIIPQKVLDELPEVIDRFEINTPVRLSHFLGQCHHESGGFRHVFENLNYSAEALLKTFPKRFKDLIDAQFYVGRPMHIADRIYANRNGNGSNTSGDGWRYRGRGYIQLTGKKNYAAFDKYVPENMLEDPDLVATKYPLLSAGWFWHASNINALVKDSISDYIIRSVTLRVNGGTHGLDNRKKITTQIHAALTGTP